MLADRRRTVVATSIAAAVLALFFLDPATDAVFPSCPLYWLTGWYCPGCGTLRAMHALLHGQIQLALHDNPLAVVAVFVSVETAVANRLLAGVARIGVWNLTDPAAVRLVITVTIVFGIVRNIPARPFVWMIP